MTAPPDHLHALVELARSGDIAGFVQQVHDLDPAVASSIVVTTCTDVFGFLLLLGLAGWIIP